MKRHAQAMGAASPTHRRMLALLAVAVAAIALALGTTAASAEAPTVSIDPASDVSYATATVTGEIDPKDAFTWWSFETSTDGGTTWSGFAFQGFGEAGTGSQAVSQELTGLKPGTAYLVRLVANNFSDSEVVSAVESFETLPVGPASVSIDPPTSITSTGAHFSGTINPEAPAGNPAAFDVSWRFECTPSCPGQMSGQIPADGDPHTVEGDAVGLKPGTDYEVTLIAENLGGPASAGPVQFATEQTPPQIISVDATPLNAEAKLSARISPGGLETTYHFEYGLTGAYGQSTAAKTIPAGGDAVAVEAKLTGLTPGSGYHYRLVASNALDTVTSADRVFTTHGYGTGADSCPNAAIREQQGSRHLGECRAYELVSPVEKGSGDVNYTQGRSQASATGDALAFTSARGFVDAVSSAKVGTYMARRGPTGWQTGSVTPPLAPSALNTLLYPEYRMFNEDLSRGVLRASEPTLAPGAPPETYSLYARDNLSGGYSLLTPEGPDEGTPFYQPFFADATEDLSQVAFESEKALTSDAPADGLTKLYERADGQLRLVGVVGGAPAPGGSAAGRGASGLFEYSELQTSRTMSRDGSRIVFTAAPDFEGDGQIYVREGGTTTIPVSVSQRSVPDPAGTQPARFEGASDDGGYVFFSTTEQMLDEDTNQDRDLYRYSVEGGALEWISKGENGEGGIEGTVEISRDGSHVYFAAGPTLVEGDPLPPTAVVVYLWREGSGLARAMLAGNGEESETVWGNGYAFGDNARISEDGRMLAAAVVQPGETRQEVMLFNAETGTTGCLSCVDGPSAGNSTLRPDNSGVGNAVRVGYNGREISADNSKVFFSTPNALVPADSNGRYDVYAYHVRSGSLALISSGRSDADSWFLDANRSGDSAFFATRERLVAADHDESFDAYVARVGGGFAEPSAPPAPCAGEACQPPGAPPLAQAPASSVATGPGNLAERHKAKKKHGKKKSQKKGSKKKNKAKKAKSRAAKQKGGRR